MHTERQTAVNVAALVTDKHVCDTCYDVRPAFDVLEDGTTASVCVERRARNATGKATAAQTPPDDGSHWHWRKSAATIARKRFNGGAIAGAHAAQSTAILFPEEEEE